MEHEFEVIHEDEHLLAVAKLPGTVVAGPDQAAPDGSLQAQVSLRSDARIFTVHRLDRGTSGIVLFAKDAQTHRHLSLLFESRQVDKLYLAVVLGHVEPRSGKVDAPLRAFGSGRVGVDQRGKPASTRYEVRERLPRADLLEVRPQTGRRHQVRVHLYSIGHPVMGDDRYGHERPVGGARRLMLHALELSFPDADGRQLTLRAVPPDDFGSILDEERAR
jgi:tRNA pseudouridine32 synthase/23S rRNA pseudouridine746 synthase